MTALQTRQASVDTLNSQEFFRLFQPVESSGDIFEIDTGIKAICVGPQSDLSDYLLYYFDEQAAINRIQELVVSVNNPFIGRLDSLNVTPFPIQNQPARLTVVTRNLVDNSYLPKGFDPVGPPADTIARFQPRVDLLAFLGDPAAIAPLRADREFNINNFVGTAGANIYFVFPYYGRRQATISISNFSSGGGAFSINVEVRGTRLGLGAIGGAGGLGRNTEILLTGVPIVIGAGQDRQVITRASEDGKFDLIVVRVDAQGLFSTNLAMDVILSDKEA